MSDTPRSLVTGCSGFIGSHRQCLSDLLRKVPLEEGTRRIAHWARAHGPRKSEKSDAVDVLKNMPPSWRTAFVER